MAPRGVRAAVPHGIAAARPRNAKKAAEEDDDIVQRVSEEREEEEDQDEMVDMDDDSEADSDEGDEDDDGDEGDAVDDEDGDEDDDDEDDNDGEDDEGDDDDDDDSDLDGDDSGLNMTQEDMETAGALKQPGLSPAVPKGRKGRIRQLNPEQLKTFQEQVERTGVIYLSRIPPFMKPQKLRSLLMQYGAIGRIYLRLEDAKARARRRKLGGNRKKYYVEGWVEFLDKRAAKRTASLLNNETIGGRKRDYYHDDIWTMKYLPKFKWHHLTEQMAYEKAVREQRLRAEIAQTKRENNFYLRNVEKAKMIAGIEERKAAKRRADGQADAAPPSDQQGRFDGVRRAFKQRRVIATEEGAAPSKEVVSRLFSSKAK